MGADESFDTFLKQVCPPRGLDWRKYRRASRRKVLDRVRQLGLAGLGEYARYLEVHPEEAEALPNLLRVTLSRFFREKEVWSRLAECIRSRLLAGTWGHTRPLSVLSIGCCNGEEPYSMALLWKDRIQPHFPTAELRITALDVDPFCLNRARTGLYSGKTLRELPPDILYRWFLPQAEGYRLHPEVRRMVSFEPCDLLHDPLPAHQDLILCRYLVFTYFRSGRRLGMTRKIAASLDPNGVLVLGRKEGLGEADRAFFRPVAGMPCLYARNGYLNG